MANYLISCLCKLKNNRLRKEPGVSPVQIFIQNKLCPFNIMHCFLLFKCLWSTSVDPRNCILIRLERRSSDHTSSKFLEISKKRTLIFIKWTIYASSLCDESFGSKYSKLWDSSILFVSTTEADAMDETWLKLLEKQADFKR